LSGNGQHNGHVGRPEGQEAAHAARAELRRVATQLERAATERVALLEELLDRAATQNYALGERLIGIDEREAGFTRRLREGLQEVDAKIAERLEDVRRFHEARANAIGDAAAERVAELVQKVEEQHHAFADAIEQRERHVDAALQQQREVIDRELQEHVEVLGYAAADKAAEIHWLAGEHREAIDQIATTRSADLQELARTGRAVVDDAASATKTVSDARRELEQRAAGALDDVQRVAAEEAAAFEELADKMFGELESSLSRQFEASHTEMVDEARRVLDAAAAETDRTRSLAHEIRDDARQYLSEVGALGANPTGTIDDILYRAGQQLEQMADAEARRLEQEAEVTRDEVRRYAVEEATAFKDLAGDRVAELRHILTDHAGLFAELTRLHQSTSEQIVEARELIDDLQHGLPDLSALNAATTRHVEAIEEHGAAAELDLRQTSTEEAQRLEEQLAAIEQLAGRRMAELEELSEEIAGLEGSALERLHELERRVQMRRSEIEQLADQRIVDLGEQVDRAEAVADEVAHRTSELAGRARDTARWLEVHPSRVEQIAEDRSEELEEALAASAARYEARLRAIAEEQTRAVEAAVAAVRDELHDVHAAPYDWAAEDRSRELEDALAESASRYEARLRAVAEEHTRAIEYAATFGRHELRHAQPATVAWDADGRAKEFEEALAAAASGHEAHLRAVADEEKRALQETAAVGKRELLDSLARAEAGLGQAVGGKDTDLGEMISAARTMFEQLSARQIEEMDMTAGALRIGIEELHRDIETALKKSGDKQVAELNRAASAWLGRLNRVGKKRRRPGFRKTGPAAVMLAIAAAFGGTMFVRAGGGDGGRSNVAEATTQTSRASTSGGSEYAPSVSPPPDAGAAPGDPSTIHWTAPGGGSQARPTGSSSTGGAGAQGAPSPEGAAPGQPGSPSSPPPSSPPPSNPPPSGGEGGGGPLDALNPILAPGTTLPPLPGL
jgi:uncharacterized protein YmfQ (DUF2313 family)